MTRKPWCFAALPVLLVPLWGSGCQVEGDDVDPETPHAARTQNDATGQRVALHLDELDHQRIREIAEYLETLADVQQAKVMVEAHDDGTAEVAVELWGHDVPEGPELQRLLREGIAGLGDADIEVTALTEPPGPRVAVDEDGDPEAVKARIEQRLRDEGVEGDVHVEVRDTPDGGRDVEVRVERHEDRDVTGPSDLGG